MTVSVIVATYNRGYIIRDALQSALDQSYSDCEIVVVDDGSSDNTRKVVEGLNSDRIRYVRHESNRGCSAAYNTGINEATGRLIAFLDSDDVWKPDYLSRQVGLLRGHPEVGVVFCDTEIQGSVEKAHSLMSFMHVLPKLVRRKAESTEHILDSREIYLCLLQEIPVKPTATVIRRELFSQGGMFDETWPSGTDCDLFLRLSKLTRFAYIDDALVIQRRTSDATHQKYREKDKQFLISVYLKEKASVVDDREAVRCVNRGMCAHYNSLAWHYLESGQGARGLAVYWEGFRETLHLRLLQKMGSAVVRIAASNVAKLARRPGAERSGGGERFEQGRKVEWRSR